MAFFITPVKNGLFAFQATHWSPRFNAIVRRVPGVERVGNLHVGTSDAIATLHELVTADGLRVNSPAPKPEEAPSILGVAPAYTGLRDYQKEGVRFLIAQAARGALLADGMGLGKTSQAIRAARALRGSGQTVVVCPSFVKGVWQDELTKWWPQAEVLVLEGVKLDAPKSKKMLDALAKTDVVILNYDIVHAWTTALTPSTVIFDELHYLMSIKARRSVACKALAQKAAHRIGLSGTPMTSRPKDLWNPIDTLTPGRFGANPFAFYLRYCGAKRVQVTPEKAVWQYDGASNLAELNRRMQHFMLRRTREDVALELPPFTRQIIDVDVPRALTKFSEASLTNPTSMRRALDLAADGKLGPAVELIASHLEDGHTVVAFCHRRVIAEQIASGLLKEGYKAAVAHGGVAQEDRRALIKARPKCIVVTLDAVAVGIDMSYADVGVFVELDWVPSKLLQGEARLYRFGQTRNVLMQYLIARGSVDALIKQAVLTKIDSFETAIGKGDDHLKRDLAGAAEKSELQVLQGLFRKLTEKGSR